MAVVEEQAGVPLPGAAVGIEVGLAGPRAFGEEHAVVFEERAFAEMELGDRAVVIDDRAVVSALGVGPTALGIEELVEGHGAGIVGRLDSLDLPLRGDATVEIGLREREVRVDVSHRLDQRVRHFHLLVLEAGAFTGELELIVADGGELAAEADRHEELCPGLPFLEPPAGERRVGVGAVERVETFGVVGAVVLIDELLTHAEEPVVAVHVEPREKEVLRGDELEFLLLDHPLLPAELRRPGERFDERLLPIEGDAGGRRLVGGADEPAVGGREPHHVAEPVLAAVDVGEGVLDVAAEEEILLARLSFLVGLAAA